jgi:formylglycine-generating enzyme required for sulfatase activity
MGTNSISNLIPGRAYYIKVNQECTLVWSSLYSLDVNVNPNETGSVVGMGNYTNGTEVIVSAIANQAYIFENWTGDTDFISNVNSPIATVIMPSSNIYLTANFVPASGGADFIDEVNGVDFEMIFVQGGTYMRGCDDCAENDRQYEAPVHSVTLSDYHIGKYEVTNAQWIAVMGGSLPWGSIWR